MTEKGYSVVEFDISEEDLALLLADGILTPRDDDSYDLTEKGNAWLESWIRKQLNAEVQEPSDKASE